MKFKTIKLADACLPTAMISLKSDLKKSVLYVDTSSIDRTLKVICSTTENSVNNLTQQFCTEIRKNDILVSTHSPELNIVAMVPPELDGQVASAKFCVLRPNEAVVDGKFLFYFTRTQNFIYTLISRARRVSEPVVSNLDIVDIELPLPSLAQQRRIVQVLDQVDSLIRRCTKVRGNSANIIKALFYEYFGHPADKSNDWPIKNLGDIVLNPPQFGIRADSVEWRDQYPRYIRHQDISVNGSLRYTDVATLTTDDWEPYRLIAGDLILAKSGSGGKAYLYRHHDGLCVYDDNLIRFTIDREQVLPEFLFVLTQTEYYKSWFVARKTSFAFSGIGKNEFVNLKIPCPPISLQESFVEHYERFIDIRNRQRISKVKMQELLSNFLQHAYFGDFSEIVDEVDNHFRSLPNER